MIALVTLAEAEPGLQTVLLGTARVAGYLGLVLLVGTSFFMTWLWPEGRTVRTFSRLLVAGAVLTVTASLAVPLLAHGLAWGSFGGREGACALARIGLVALAGAFGSDVVRSARSWRVPISLWQLALVQTYVLASNAVGGPWEIVKVVATTGHLVATAAWLGGLVTLASVLVPSTDLKPLHSVLPRFSLVAIASVATLFVSGTLHALAIAGGVRPLLRTDYGVALGLKVLVVVLMLLLGDRGRRYAEQVGRRKLAEIDDSAPPESVQAFAVAIGAELALGLGVLAATAALVHVAPT